MMAVQLSAGSAALGQPGMRQELDDAWRKLREMNPAECGCPDCMMRMISV
jgi:hypothetical protein